MKVTAEHLDTPSKSDTFTQLPTRSSSSSIEHDGRIHAATQTDQKDRIVLLIAFMPKKNFKSAPKIPGHSAGGKKFRQTLSSRTLTAGIDYTFQFGASVDDSYLAVSGRSGLDWALSTGMSFPLRNSTAFYWSLRFKRNSYTYPTRNTVTENMLTLTLGVSFGETWFVRRKFE